VALYERLRTEVLEARARPEGIAALRFHGMLQGLAILLKISTMAPPNTEVPASPPVQGDSEFVRLLANLVLHTHSELTHVC
jgi:hypothetical protein